MDAKSALLKNANGAEKNFIPIGTICVFAVPRALFVQDTIVLRLKENVCIAKKHSQEKNVVRNIARLIAVMQPKVTNGNWDDRH